MKSFKQYLAENAREYGYVIKLVTEPTEEQCTTLANYLQQFSLMDITAPQILVGDNMDFVDIQNHTVYQINFITGQPLSSYVTMQGLRDVLNVAEKLIVVRSATEPVEMNADRRMEELSFGKKAADQGLKSAPRLSTDRLYQDVEQPITTDIFGDEYNKRFLDYLASTKQRRPTDQYDAPSPLFSWLDMNKVKSAEPVQDSADFNAKYDTPKPVTKSTGNAPDPTPRSGLGAEGNFDDGAVSLYKFYQDADGKRVNLSSPRAPNKPEFVKKG